MSPTPRPALRPLAVAIALAAAGVVAACGGSQAAPPASSEPPPPVAAGTPPPSTEIAEGCPAQPGECRLACENYARITANAAPTDGAPLSPDACLAECGANVDEATNRSWACYEKSATAAAYEACQDRCQPRP